MHSPPPTSARGPGRQPVLVLVGPSGAGKSTLVAALARLGVVSVHPTWTTRPPRPHEVAVGCPEHRFVSDRRFDQLAGAGFFTDAVRPFGGAHRYGLPPLPRRPAGSPATVERIDTVLLRATYLDRVAAELDPMVVYQVEAPPAVLAARLAARGTDPADIRARVAFDAEDSAIGRCWADRILANEGTPDSLVARTLAVLAEDLGSARTITVGAA
jgi:ribose 1,5-bisphosphokinase PhnN